MPVEYEISQATWDAIMLALAEKMAEEGIPASSPQILEVMRQWWGFLSDRTLRDAYILSRVQLRLQAELVKIDARRAEVVALLNP